MIVIFNYTPLICQSMETIYTRSCFYRREYFILLDRLVVIDMRLCFFFSEFDEIMPLQGSILASRGKFCKCRFFCCNFFEFLQLVETYV